MKGFQYDNRPETALEQLKQRERYNALRTDIARDLYVNAMNTADLMLTTHHEPDMASNVEFARVAYERADNFLTVTFDQMRDARELAIKERAELLAKNRANVKTNVPPSRV